MLILIQFHDSLLATAETLSEFEIMLLKFKASVINLYNIIITIHLMYNIVNI